MNNRTVAIAVAALIIGAAGGYTLRPVPAPAAPTMDMAMGDMTTGLRGKDGATFEQAFVEEMIVHHQGAVAMAELVLQKSQRPELVKLANDIIAAQTGEITLMQGWLATWFSAASHTAH